ncbi:Arylsulfotransferase (ASST) [Flavobacterium gillisiae]|uniref:Arylsulfotransferase (ASST) n=1 Tax=Flavobacterium gillisiae TaxID=150146 RepID=A0A1H4F6F5_9FLAO|nr:aryl-sulfate sulfotransferase [Flavobacterium gillisiae]SEA92894.1 Arylsulfotransferase (ASST) [Flavobacterium gillisiae]
MTIHNLIKKMTVIFGIYLVVGCSGNDGNIIETISIGTHGSNQLQIQIDVVTSKKAEVFAEYWPDRIGIKGKMASLISNNGLAHSIVITNITPLTNYSYQLVTYQDGIKKTSKIYNFKSGKFLEWIQKQFEVSFKDSKLLPQEFKEGFMLLSKRETPGVAYIIDYRGNLRWYHAVDKTGFKVSRFTDDQSIISILGNNDDPASYGSEILEINLLGDTLTHLKKGEGDLQQVIHHEIIKKSKEEIVTLYVDEKIIDLRSIGGKEKDTIKGDGILILDRKGKKLWKWSVFDVMDPMKDPHLLKTKKDWMHANSLNYDKDGNFIISFYNNGQIWKVDSHNGKVIWKIGKGGTIAMPADCNFSQAHAVHINSKGNLMFFDNGVDKHQSSVFALNIDEKNQKAKLDLHIKLPVKIYNERMGSAYMIGDSAILACCSKKNKTVLVDTEGTILWTLESNFPPYRVQFIPKEKLKPFLLN